METNPENPTIEMHRFAGRSEPVPAHRHPRGGGWVAETAFVDASAKLEPGAEVFDRARVLAGSCVYARACVRDDAVVEGAVVGEDGTVADRAYVGHGCCVTDQGFVGGYARLSEGVHVGGDAMVIENAQVQGAHILSHGMRLSGRQRIGPRGAILFAYFGPNAYSATVTPTHLKIGCTVMTHEEWRREGRRLAADHGLSERDYKLMRATLVPMMRAVAPKKRSKKT